MPGPQSFPYENQESHNIHRHCRYCADMRTTFTFDDDKPLVHLAQGYIDGGTHIPWSDVAHIMRSTKHTAVAHRQPLQALSSGTSRPVHEGGYCHKKKKLLRPHRSQDRGRHQNLTQGLEQHVKQHAQQRLNYLKEVGQQPLQLYCPDHQKLRWHELYEQMHETPRLCA
ncbi:hypothetical protein PInf_025148 [Phytophthora infestans]|nr:hypothetical protein PInf_025148 [Phytophthora infestans]